MDRFEAMGVFLTAVDAGSLSAAGRRLGMPLATVSRKIGDLETHLKTRLLLRGGRHLELTDAGRSYLAACRRIVEDVGEAERTAAGEYRAPTGELVISAPLVYGRLHVVPVVSAFLKAYPDIHIRMLLTDRVVNLVDDHIDMAVRIGVLPDSSLIATRVGHARLCVFASPSYFTARGVPRRPDEVRAHDCIAFDAVSTGDRWDFVQDGVHHAVAIQPRLRANTAEAVIEAAHHGLGLARAMSYPLGEALAAKTLRLVLEEYELPPVPISLVYPAQRLLPLKLRAFMDYAAPRLRARMEQQA